MKLTDIRSTLPVATGNPRGGLELQFDLSPAAPVQSSPVWNTAGWSLRFLFLPAHGTLSLPDGQHCAKVITGSLRHPARGCFADDFEVRSTRLLQSDITAGERGVLLALLTEDDSVPNVHEMAQCRFKGPESDQLEWRSFRERFGRFTDYFNELDNHMMDGFHLLDAAGDEIVYVNFWTCGAGGDVSTHNHAQDPSPMAPAFVEVHLVLNNGTGAGGMYESGADEKRKHHPMQRGEEHGPFFDHEEGRPIMHPNGAVSYPWHGWQSGPRAGRLAYDFVAAFEINPRYAELSAATSAA